MTIGKEQLNSIFIFLLLLLAILASAQKKYYRTFEGLLLTEENYLANKKEIEERKDLAGRIYVIPVKTEVKEDSIIKHVKFEYIPLIQDSKGKKYDPYNFQRKMIGLHFPVEIFKDHDSNYFSSDFLKGKPTIINFWFTECPPCIAELPVLADLKNEFGDSVNYIAITFEGKKDVERFLKGYPSFKYFHVTNAKRAINELKIQAFPITFLLNEKGEIINIYGDLIFQFDKLRELLLRLL